MSRRSRSRQKEKGAPSIHVGRHEFDKIKRMWAENGIVRMEREPDGKVINLSIEQAAGRAQALNNMLPAMVQHKAPSDWVANTLKLVERVIEVCREARAQIARPDGKTAKLQNVIHGCDADGKPLINRLPESYWISRFTMRYHTLKEHEVAAAVRGTPSMVQAERILAEMHRQRMAADSPAKVV